MPHLSPQVLVTLLVLSATASVPGEPPEDVLSDAGLKRHGNAFILKDLGRRIAERDRLLAEAGAIRSEYWLRNEQRAVIVAHVGIATQYISANQFSISTLIGRTFTDKYEQIIEYETDKDGKRTGGSTTTTGKKVVSTAGDQARARDREVANLMAIRSTLTQDQADREQDLGATNARMAALEGEITGLRVKYQKLTSETRQTYAALAANASVKDALGKLEPEKPVPILGTDQDLKDYAFALLPTPAEQFEEKGLDVEGERLLVPAELEVISSAIGSRKLQHELGSLEKARAGSIGRMMPRSQYGELTQRRRRLSEATAQAAATQAPRIKAELGLVEKRIAQLAEKGIASDRDEVEHAAQEMALKITEKRREFAQAVLSLRALADGTEAFRKSLAEDLELKVTMEAVNTMRKQKDLEFNATTEPVNKSRKPSDHAPLKSNHARLKTDHAPLKTDHAPLKIVIRIDYTRAMKDLEELEKLAPAEKPR